jgi:hypothetical protein
MQILSLATSVPFLNFLAGLAFFVDNGPRCALALRGLASRQLQGDKRQVLELLTDALNYLGDVVAMKEGAEDSLKKAAAAAMKQCKEELELAMLP